MATEQHRIGKHGREKRSLLVIGHPGHELRVYGWMFQHHPDVVIMTDGSGHSGRSRIASSHKVVCETGSAPTDVFGQLTDLDAYRCLLEQRFTTLDPLIETVVARLQSAEYGVVAGDDYEGYNPTHDLCRVIIDCAVEAARASGIIVENLAFNLAPDPRCSFEGEDLRCLELSDAVFEAKMKAAYDYVEMRGEVEHAVRAFGREALRRETLFVAGDYRVTLPPYYERYGERRQRARIYDEIIRFQQHVVPAIDYIRQQTSACARRHSKSYSRTAS